MSAGSWSEAISGFTAAQLARGVAESSIDVHRRRLLAAARGLGAPPAALTGRQVADWLGAHPGAQSTIKGYRLTLRAFFAWARDAGIVEHDPMPVRGVVSRYTTGEAWQDALSDYQHAARRDGRTATTIAQRTKHVTRFALASGTSPWKVTAPEVAEWLDSLPSGRATRNAHRVSLRAFYRWAAATGRIEADPLIAEDRLSLRLGTPEGWAGELHAYLRALRAQGRPASTLEARRQQLERFARDHGRRDPYTLTMDDLLEWLGTKRWAAETRRTTRSALVSFYRWAEETGRLDVSPASALPSVKGGQYRARPAMEHELREALRNGGPREQLALRLAAELGLRRGEVALIHSRDLIQVPGDSAWWLTVHGKGGVERRVPLTEALARALRTLPPGFAFPGRDHGHISPRYLGKRLSELLPPGVTMHALRHRFATKAYNIDRDVFAVQQFLGHATPATTQRYVLVAESRLRALGDAVAV